MFATQTDAHYEWHINAGVPMGTPGCPQDACHPVDDPHDYFPAVLASGVRCGSPYHERGERAYHQSAAQVRECFQTYRDFFESPEDEPVDYSAAPVEEPQSQSLHQSPCVCGPYDLCRGVRAQRAQDRGDWREHFRTYND